MKQILFFIFTISLFFAVVNQPVFAIPNPWTDCGDSLVCASEQAGFEFPLRAKDSSIRAMQGMIEITFPFGRRRTVTVRKAQIVKGREDSNGIVDISGDYNNYPVNKTIYLKNGVPFQVRGTHRKFYAASFGAESDYYSFSSAKGLKLKDIESLYKLVRDAEAP